MRPNIWPWSSHVWHVVHTICSHWFWCQSLLLPHHSHSKSQRIEFVGSKSLWANLVLRGVLTLCMCVILWLGSVEFNISVEIDVLLYMMFWAILSSTVFQLFSWHCIRLTSSANWYALIWKQFIKINNRYWNESVINEFLIGNVSRMRYWSIII